MKIQLQQQSVRLRLDESELAQMLDGATLLATTRFGVIGNWSMALCLQADDHVSMKAAAEAVLISLPYDSVQALAGRLPCRDGLAWEVEAGGATLQLQFDVDVRDSVRQRGPRRRTDAAVTPSV
ncbi:hypothetical protein D3C81_945690 [compost metagenome]